MLVEQKVTGSSPVTRVNIKSLLTFNDAVFDTEKKKMSTYSVLNRLTGGDVNRSEAKFEKIENFTFNGKIIINTNSTFSIPSNILYSAVKRRYNIFSFSYSQEKI